MHSRKSAATWAPPMRLLGTTLLADASETTPPAPTLRARAIALSIGACGSQCVRTQTYLGNTCAALPRSSLLTLRHMCVLNRHFLRTRPMQRRIVHSCTWKLLARCPPCLRQLQVLLGNRLLLLVRRTRWVRLDLEGPTLQLLIRGRSIQVHQQVALSVTIARQSEPALRLPPLDPEDAPAL